MIYVIVILLVIHLGFYVLIFASIIKHKVEKGSNQDALSLLVSFKNESDAVSLFHKEIKKQSLNSIVYIDDYSEDNTFQKLEEIEDTRIIISQPDENVPGKKKAIQKGISLSITDRILFTDADCAPASKDWASLMNSKSGDIVLGYAPYYKRKSIIGLFSRYETFITALQYLGYTKIGIPYMGVGRNMLMNRTLREKKLIKGQSLASGDDDLSVNACSNRYNTEICIHSDAFVYSEPPSSWQQFLKQKSRHLSTSIYYKFIHQVLLSAWSGTQILIYLLLILSYFYGTITISEAFIILLSKWIIQMSILLPISKKLKEEDLLLKHPFLDILLFIYYLVMPVVIMISKKENKWS